jgi:hypothetical protein
LANYNPASPYLGRTALEKQSASGGNGVYGTNPTYHFDWSSNIYNLSSTGSSGESAYVGFTESSGPTIAVLFDLPRSNTGILSLGALQHLNPHSFSSTLGRAHANTQGASAYTYPGGAPYGYQAGAMPAYAIGNSYADPRVNPADSDGFPDDWNFATGVTEKLFHFDSSYVLNQVLWDRYYFSSVPETGSISSPLPNARYEVYDPDVSANLETELRGYDTAASRLMVAGAFNVNSTSTEAWRALIASMRNAPVPRNNGTTAMVVNNQKTVFNRFTYTEGNMLNSSADTASSANTYSGFRALTDSQVNELATGIVAQVKSRGPFKSMAKFVNRTPSSANASERIAGALQAAIDICSINNSVNLPIATGKSDSRFYDAAGSGSSTSFAPGSLNQADLLQALGPVLSARSDTFLIRSYGETLNPTTQAPASKAYCEVVVQRMPDFINATTDNAEAWPVNGPDNDKLGRRFKILSFRWLNTDDL